MVIYWKTTSRLFACLLGLFVMSIGPQVGLAEPTELSKKKSLIGMSLGQLEGVPAPLEAELETMHPKLDGPLNRIAKQAARSPFTAVSTARSMGLKTLKDSIWVLILADPARGNEAIVAIGRLGGKDLISTRSRPDRLRCWLPVDALVPLANEPSVLRITPPQRPVHTT